MLTARKYDQMKSLLKALLHINTIDPVCIVHEKKGRRSIIFLPGLNSSQNTTTKTTSDKINAIIAFLAQSN